MPSPAQRYADAARRRVDEGTGLARFAATLPFPLDDFQQQAARAVADGHAVLVAAPTGAGKTVVGEFAVFKALERGCKAFYTTPIKALSNQKYLELVDRYGKDSVGLLTGDTSINSEAPIVVMTTEVLRNMLYADSSTLSSLGYVVMDEVHYLADRFRGPVWEEVILQLAAPVQLIALSATVSNAEEFGDWLREIRGECTVVVSEHRPVPLWQHVMVGRDLHDLYTSDAPTHSPGESPPISRELTAAIRTLQGRHRPATTGRGRGRGRYHQRRPMLRPQRRVVVDQLDRSALLPAIIFVFSRAGCDDAVAQVVSSGISLTTEADRDRIGQVIAERTATLPPLDLQALGFAAWERALLAGVAAHHAGLLPAFKEVVEVLFAAGALKVVFATETLALGINMPARSVVLEKLTKWDGNQLSPITAGQYTQLTGRAGRRGIDIEGHAVVLYEHGLDPHGLAGLASRRTYPLRSAFRPTYNMAVNLIAGIGWERSREVLESSFAQFQTDRAVVGLARRAQKLQRQVHDHGGICDRGDFAEYMRVRSQIAALEAQMSRARTSATRQAVAEIVASLRRGDVVAIPRGRRAGYAVVLDAEAMHRRGEPALLLLTQDGQVRRLYGAEIPYGIKMHTHVRIAKSFSERRPRDRRDLASTMRNALGASLHRTPERVRKPTMDGSDAGRLKQMQQRLRHHPCHSCPEREDHAATVRATSGVESERQQLLDQITTRTSSIARDFDKICGVLSEFGYLGQRADGFAVLAQGQVLRRIYSERDLLIAQCLHHGLWQELEPAELAAMVAGLTYEARSEEPSVRPRSASGRLSRALHRTDELARSLGRAEQQAGMEASTPLDWGLVEPMFQWASGGTLAEVISEISAGDFVRWCRQVIDVLDQLAQAAPDSLLQQRAMTAIGQVRRGVVALDGRT
ncbi:MAG: DEAD/DEAH box helicase [Beutenbergiaceae bacterium]